MRPKISTRNSIISYILTLVFMLLPLYLYNPNYNYIVMAAKMLDAHNLGDDYIFDNSNKLKDLKRFQSYCSALVPYHNTLRSEYYSDGSKKLTLRYVTSMEVTRRDFAESTAKKIIEENITDNMSAEQKIRIIHDWLIKNVRYTNDWQSDGKYTAVSIFYYKTGNCAAYARAFKMLCDEASIPCIYEEGYTPEGLHAWNLVFADGKWYNIDVTFDDPRNGNDNYKYYMIPADEPFPDHEYTLNLTQEDYLELANFIYFKYKPQPKKPLEKTFFPEVTPEIIKTSFSKIVPVNAHASVSVDAKSKTGGELSYQWYINETGAAEDWKPIEGATDYIYTTINKEEGKTEYFCVITDNDAFPQYGVSARASTGTITITVKKETLKEYDTPQPIITTQPQSAVIEEDTTATLTIDAKTEGGGVLTYQWYESTSPDIESFTPINNATDNIFTTPKLSATTYYYCIVTSTNRTLPGNEVAQTISEIVKLETR